MEGIYVNQDGPSLIIEAPIPPPPPGPHLAKDVTKFYIYVKTLSIVFPCCTYVSSVMRSS